MEKAAVVCAFALALCLTASALPNGTTPGEHAGAKVTLPVSVAPDTPPTNVSPPHAAQPVRNDSVNATSAPTKMSDSPTPMSIIPTKLITGLTTTIAPAATEAPTTNATSSTMAPTKVPTTPGSVAPKTKPSGPSSTEHSKVVSTTAVPIMARGFDGASFIGGIILTLGLLAAGFVGFKYYKTQTERNYHTL